MQLTEGFRITGNNNNTWTLKRALSLKFTFSDNSGSHSKAVFSSSAPINSIEFYSYLEPVRSYYMVSW